MWERYLYAKLFIYIIVLIINYMYYIYVCIPLVIEIVFF